MKILLIDDAEDIRKIASLSLEYIGRFQVEEAECAKVGLALAATFQPDAILLDMMMPDMDGLGTLAALRSDPALAAIPVIFMTARVQSSEVAHYLSVGAAGVIEKPFDPLTLPQEIRAILQQSSAA